MLPASTIYRFKAKCTVAEGNACWPWHGAAQPNGYGQLWNGRRPEQAHRVSYKLFVGAIPAGLEIDHRCKNRGCVNPKHLRLVTHKENMRGADNVIGANARKTKCKRGHSLSGNNLRIDISGNRQCRACDTIRYKERRKRLGYV